jgi:hypothetical protein
VLPEPVFRLPRRFALLLRFGAVQVICHLFEMSATSFLQLVVVFLTDRFIRADELLPPP